MPAGWTASGVSDGSTLAISSAAPGTFVSMTFKVTSGSAAFNGDLVGNATWTTNGQTRSEKIAEKVRNVSPIKINEFAISSTSPANATNSFIELYNAGTTDVDLSNWSLTQHPIQQAFFFGDQGSGWNKTCGSRLLSVRPLQFRSRRPRPHGQRHPQRPQHQRHERR